jgi:hypothetical protein
MKQADTWLVMALEPQLVLAVSAREPGDELVLDSIRYHSSDEGAVTGFYDRILNDAGRFAGIRIWPMAERAEALMAALPERPYLRVAPREGCVDVYFDGPPYPNASSEGDQAFGGRFYRGAGGHIAISLDLGYLADSEEDLQAVQSARVRWATLAR